MNRPPHPLDYEWRELSELRSYYKLQYDVRLADGSLYRNAWPNAGAISTGEQRYEFGSAKSKGVSVRISPYHSSGQPQLAYCWIIQFSYYGLTSEDLKRAQGLPLPGDAKP